jgi:hypothetical protein
MDTWETGGRDVHLSRRYDGDLFPYYLFKP